MTKDEALELSLEAQSYAAACLLNQLSTKDKHAYAVEKLSASTAAIKEALAQPEQEPVADVLIDHEDEDGHAVIWLRDYALENGRHILYTTPPQRKPLSVEKILHLVDTHVGAPSMSYPLNNSDWINFARAIEAAHGIKDENARGKE